MLRASSLLFYPINQLGLTSVSLPIDSFRDGDAIFYGFLCSNHQIVNVANIYLGLVLTDLGDVEFHIDFDGIHYVACLPKN